MSIGGSVGEAIADGTEAVYDRTAAVYDRFTEHHDYELWVGNLLPALERAGLQAGQMLDVGCGTGKSFLPMLARGWSVTGVDISAQMLARARAKTAADGVRLVHGDMRELPVLGEFELVWCLDDGINYLLGAEELAACLRGFSANLANGGLCVFDVNTLAGYRGFFATTDQVDAGAVRLTWHGHESEDFLPGGLATATLEVETPAGSDRIVHRQRHFPPQEIEITLADSDLELIEVYGITTAAVLEQPLDETRHTKAIFVSRPARRR